MALKLLLMLALVAPALAQCGAGGSFSTNIAWETAGEEVPGFYGTQDVIGTKIPFVNVPAGCHVRIVRVTGDQVAAPHGVPSPGTVAYTLVGLTNSTPWQSPAVGPGLGSQGCFLYKQQAITGSTPGRIAIDKQVRGDLNADNILMLKQALFLDEFGPQAPVHMELSLVITFRYVPN